MSGFSLSISALPLAYKIGAQDGLRVPHGSEIEGNKLSSVRVIPVDDNRFSPEQIGYSALAWTPSEGDRYLVGGPPSER